MKTIAIWMAATVVVCAAFGPSASAAPEIVLGRVQIHSVNEDDLITGICIENDIERFIVVDTVEGRRLFKFIGTDVAAQGNVSKDADGNRTLEVLSFEILEDDAPSQSNQ